MQLSAAVHRTTCFAMADGQVCRTAFDPCSLFVLGLTGSIGMGKSTVSGFFKEAGVPVWDADAAVHKLYSAGGAAVGPVGESFPGVVVDGAVSRTILSSRVVGNEAAIKRLESIVHPLVSHDRLAFLEQLASQAQPLAVVDIPLLYESGAEQYVDAVAVASAPSEVQRQRVLGRPGMTDQKFEAILARQVPDEDKRRRATYVIDTGTSLQETRQAVEALAQSLQARPGAGAWAKM